MERRHGISKKAGVFRVCILKKIFFSYFFFILKREQVVGARVQREKQNLKQTSLSMEPKEGLPDLTTLRS